MSGPHLLPEILDHVLDILHYEPETLHSCCLVAKSWVPHTRRHLFYSVSLPPKDLCRWKKMFPDPFNSPACYTRNLDVRCSKDITMADAAEGGWISSFSGVLELKLRLRRHEHSLDTLEMFLAPFHGFSPTLKNLHVDSRTLPCSRFFKLACSFPFLEDLTIVCKYVNIFENLHAPQVIIPSTSPTLTGSFDLKRQRSLKFIARGLLDLPNGLRFRRFSVSWRHTEDILCVKRLVVACRDTLEFLDVECLSPGASLTSLSQVSTEFRSRRLCISSFYD